MNQTGRRFIHFLVPLFALFYLACHHDTIYQQKIQLSNNNWPYSQVLNYHWSVQDTASWYRMSLNIEHIPDLHYRNLYVKCITHYPDSSNNEQILSLELFNEAGIPFGRCSSSNCKTEIPILPKYKFHSPGEYSLNIVQFGRDSIVNGLFSFELEISKIPNN